MNLMFGFCLLSAAYSSWILTELMILPAALFISFAAATSASLLPIIWKSLHSSVLSCLTFFGDLIFDIENLPFDFQF